MEINRMIQEMLADACARKEALTNELSGYPPGNILINASGKKEQFYKVINGKRIYLNKSSQAEIETLLKKKQLQLTLEDEEQILRALEAYRKVFFRKPENGRYWEQGREEQFLSKETVRSLLHASQDDANAWQYASYRHLEKYPEGLRFELPDGRKVRSKTEMAIGAELLTLGIPFRYEPAIELPNRVVHPDFMVKRLRDNTIKIWEHLGMMDNLDYLKYAADKIKDYILGGYYPGQNLILTTETLDDPFDYVKIRKVIQVNFL